jgi:hypothetical protein
MKTYPVTLPEMAIVALTRGMAGAGLGLLVGGSMQRETRRTLGWTLLALGAASTIPILFALLGNRRGNGRDAASASRT